MPSFKPKTDSLGDGIWSHGLSIGLDSTRAGQSLDFFKSCLLQKNTFAFISVAITVFPVKTQLVRTSSVVAKMCKTLKTLSMRGTKSSTGTYTAFISFLIRIRNRLHSQNPGTRKAENVDEMNGICVL